MRVLHVNASESVGGAARSAYRLHKALSGQGIDSLLAVQSKQTDDESVLGPESGFHKLIAINAPALDSIPARLYRSRTPGIFSSAIVPDRLHSVVREAAPDIVNLHWIGYGFVRIETLALLAQPVVWTLHDSWAFTGGCHLPGSCSRFTLKCGRCPRLGSKQDWDLSRWVWRRKQKAWQKLTMTVVAPSHWIAERARSSKLLGDFPIEVIQNGIDTHVYRPMERMAMRALLGLPQDRALVMFSAMWASRDPNKGLRHFAGAVKALAGDHVVPGMDVVLVGSSVPGDVGEGGLPVHCLGAVRDEAMMAMLYAAVDVVVVASREENLPNVAMEALACGTPVVGFSVGGLPDLIESGTNGVLVRPYDDLELAKAIAWTLGPVLPSLRAAARKSAENGFDVAIQAARYAAVYRSMLADRVGATKARTSFRRAAGES